MDTKNKITSSYQINTTSGVEDLSNKIKTVSVTEAVDLIFAAAQKK